jgi:hypothetical protein
MRAVMISTAIVSQMPKTPKLRASISASKAGLA